MAIFRFSIWHIQLLLHYINKYFSFPADLYIHSKVLYGSSHTSRPHGQCGYSGGASLLTLELIPGQSLLRQHRVQHTDVRGYVPCLLLKQVIEQFFKR